MRRVSGMSVALAFYPSGKIKTRPHPEEPAKRASRRMGRPRSFETRTACAPQDEAGREQCKCGEALLLRLRRLQDRRPARGLGLHIGLERRRAALLLARDRAAELVQTLDH